VRGCRFWAALITATAVASVIELGTSAVADSGDKPGWSVLTDPRRRAFLIFVPAADGPRVLTLGCLRDVDSFTVLSRGFRTVANARRVAARSHRSTSYLVIWLFAVAPSAMLSLRATQICVDWIVQMAPNEGCTLRQVGMDDPVAGVPSYSRSSWRQRAHTNGPDGFRGDIVGGVALAGGPDWR
jgi:hypothetical protein